MPGRTLQLDLPSPSKAVMKKRRWATTLSRPHLTNSDSLCDVRIISAVAWFNPLIIRHVKLSVVLAFALSSWENSGHAAVESRLGNSPRVAALRWSVSGHLVCGGYLAT